MFHSSSEPQHPVSPPPLLLPLLPLLLPLLLPSPVLVLELAASPDELGDVDSPMVVPGSVVDVADPLIVVSAVVEPEPEPESASGEQPEATKAASVAIRGRIRDESVTAPARVETRQGMIANDQVRKRPASAPYAHRQHPRAACGTIDLPRPLGVRGSALLVLTPGSGEEIGLLGDILDRALGLE